MKITRMQRTNTVRLDMLPEGSCFYKEDPAFPLALGHLWIRGRRRIVGRSSFLSRAEYDRIEVTDLVLGTHKTAHPETLVYPVEAAINVKHECQEASP